MNAKDVPEATIQLSNVSHSNHAMSLPAGFENRALNSSFMVLNYDVDGVIQNANFAFLRKFACNLSDVMGENALQFMSKSHDRTRVQRLWERLASGNSIVETELWIAKTGKEIWLQSHYTPILSETQQLQGVVQIAEDISARLLQELEDHSQVEAIQTTHVVVHFTIDGQVIWVNDAFLTVTGYTRAEVIQQPHKMFVDEQACRGACYQAFWEKLRSGEHHSGEFKRVGKDGRKIWLQAVYTPVKDPAGRILKVVKYANDITEEKLRQADFQSQIVAIHKSNCVVTFDMHGSILDANPPFLDEMGYKLEEVKGRHHRLFVEPSYAHSTDYATFWSDLRRGKYRSGLYKRYAKTGHEVWLQATYNPVFDTEGNTVKVVEYAQIVTDEKLVQAEHQGQIAAINKSQCVIAFRLDGTILDANDNFLTLMGYRFSEVYGQHHRLFVPHAEANSDAYQQFWQDLATGRHQSGEYKRMTRDGREVWLSATYNPIRDMDGRVFKVMKYANDITESKLMYADFKGQIDAIRLSQDVVVFDLGGYIIDINERAAQTLGYRVEELLGQHHAMLVDRTTVASKEYLDFWATLKEGRHVSGLHRRQGKGGREIWLQASYNPILDLNGQSFKVVKFATDVTENVAMAEAFEESRRQALIDAVTSLPNRSKLTNFMGTFLGFDGAVMAVFYIDLDGFSELNRDHGRRAGDRVLAEVADRFRRLLRQDQMVARVGGDEFVVAVPGMAMECVERFCQEMIAKVTTPILIAEDTEVSIGTSIGVALAPSDGTTPDELLHASDLALAAAKKHGGSTFSFFSEEYNAKLYGKRQLIEEMRHSLTAGDFYLDYQPRFHAVSRHIESAEALVRWSHPERGRVSPAEFIPLAEQTGMILQMGEWILRTACQEAVNWLGVGVSVNLSPAQFSEPTLIPKVKAILAETGLPAHLLELEITEGVLVSDSGHALSILNDLKSIGVKLAIDDFGTGYSSLSYLRNFPFDVIKIDRSFVKDLDAADSSRPVIQAIIALGKALHLSVTAEGVETNDQLEILADDGCDEIQGFLLAMPSTKDDVIKLARRRQDHHD